MEIPQVAQQVEAVFADLDAQISGFQSSSGLHCKWGCGKCCFKADLEATALEFIPFALHQYKANEAWNRLERIRQEEVGLCPILNPTQGGAGLCSEYAHRGLICRLFGYSARLNKHREKELVTCAIIKTEQTESYEKAARDIRHQLPIPVMSDFYMQLYAIDPDLSREFFPIRQAIKRALEIVLQYYAYRENE
jgi:Fe-S-cluster containining protein